ncbi:MAG: carbonic anhydrase family protein [Alphaproteobacteria bacterium]|nr:carbonic anhydrase family protein [Alphaproteobacteria bacterium]
MKLWKLITIISLGGVHASEAHAVFWNYAGMKTGPDSWGELAPEFEKCAGGSAQSPVSISTTKVMPLPALEFDYKTTAASLALDRFTVVSTPQEKLYFREGDRHYLLKEMVMHTPSEHDVEGDFYPIELQLLHEGDEKKLLMLSIFLRSTEGAADNAALQAIIGHYPATRQDRPSTHLDWQALLPKNLGYYAYPGSITTPPCTEGVEIRVLKTPLEVSAGQIKWLVEKLGRNARDVQPVLLRTIRESERE